MNNKGITLIETVISLGLLALVIGNSIQVLPYVSRFFGYSTSLYTGLVQINSLQHVAARDIERAESLIISSDFRSVSLLIEGDVVLYQRNSNYFTRTITNTTKLNSDSLQLQSFEVRSYGKTIELNYSWKIGNKTIVVRDSTYAYNLI